MRNSSDFARHASGGADDRRIAASEPLTIVDAGRRFESPVVRSSADFGSARVFFHDGDSYPEAEGFWVKGRDDDTAHHSEARRKSDVGHCSRFMAAGDQILRS